MVFNAHTAPAVNIPSKNTEVNLLIPKISLVNPPRNIDMTNPTHVDVHSVQLIRSPKNLECAFIHVLGFSKILPHTNIDVNPYATSIQKINMYIYYNLYQNNK